MKNNSKHKPAPLPQKIEDARDPLPRTLELQFRRLLGRHNSHLNMLDVSAQTFADLASKEASERVYLRDRAKALGFHSLYPYGSFASARTYLVYSHIAYVCSAGDMLCERIRSTKSMRALKNADMKLFNAIDDGDFVTKTVALAVLATMDPDLWSEHAVRLNVERTRSLESFALVNYFRLIRNEEFHATDETKSKVAAAWSALPKDRIETRYKTMPTAPNQDASSCDALLCSKAWQDVAKWLCRHMLGSAEVQVIIKQRFRKLEERRRDIAARKFLKLELLYSEEDIDATMSAVKW